MSRNGVVLVVFFFFKGEIMPLLMVKKSSKHQLSLVFARLFSTSQVVVEDLWNHQQYQKPTMANSPNALKIEWIFTCLFLHVPLFSRCQHFVFPFFIEASVPLRKNCFATWMEPNLLWKQFSRQNLPVIFGNHLSIKRVVRMAQGKDCQSGCWSQRCKAPQTNLQKSLEIIFFS